MIGVDSLVQDLVSVLILEQGLLCQLLQFMLQITRSFLNLVLVVNKHYYFLYAHQVSLHCTIQPSLLNSSLNYQLQGLEGLKHSIGYQCYLNSNIQLINTDLNYFKVTMQQTFQLEANTLLYQCLLLLRESSSASKNRYALAYAALEISYKCKLVLEICLGGNCIELINSKYCNLGRKYQ